MPAHGVSFAEAFKVWLRVALLSFGGPAGQIAVMHRIVVEERRWISEARFLHALNYCHLLPGPEAQQLAIYIGWLMHKTRGGLVAGVLFVVPGVIALMALSWIYVIWGNVSFVAGLFFGLKAAVLAVVIEAVLRVGRRALKSQLAFVIAGCGLRRSVLFRRPLPACRARSGARSAWSRIGSATPWAATPPMASDDDATGREACRITPVPLLRARSRSSRSGCRFGSRRSRCCSVAWGRTIFSHGSRCSSAKSRCSVSAAPMRCWLTSHSRPSRTYHWLLPGEMLTGLGMAETTPGPLIMVVQYVGFLAGYRTPESCPLCWREHWRDCWSPGSPSHPASSGCFLGAPYVEALRGVRALGAALSAVTAAVVGVILNLAVWFGVHVIFRETMPWRGFGLDLSLPVLPSIDIFATILAIAAAVAIFRFKVGIIQTLLACSLAGVVLQLPSVWRYDDRTRSASSRCSGAAIPKPGARRRPKTIAGTRSSLRWRRENIQAEPAVYCEERQRTKCARSF